MIKQKNIPWLGAFIEALYNSLPFLSIINFLSVTVVLYGTIRPYLEFYTPWMKIWLFLIIIGVLTSLVMLLVYKFVLISIWTFRGKQMSSVNEKLDKILERLEGLEHESRNHSPHKGT